MITGNPYQQYKEQSLSTLAPGELLVKLYDEMIKQMRIAVLGIEKKDFAKVNDSLVKAQSIVGTLESSLDMQYEVSQNLRQLYIFIAKQLMQANIKKDIGMIEDCIPIVRDMRDSFEQADKITRKSHAAVGGRAV